MQYVEKIKEDANIFVPITTELRSAFVTEDMFWIEIIKAALVCINHFFNKKNTSKTNKSAAGNKLITSRNFIFKDEITS